MTEARDAAHFSLLGDKVDTVKLGLASMTIQMSPMSEKRGWRSRWSVIFPRVDSAELVGLNIPDTFLDPISLEKWTLWPVELEKGNAEFSHSFRIFFLTRENAEYAKLCVQWRRLVIRTVSAPNHWTENTQTAKAAVQTLRELQVTGAPRPFNLHPGLIMFENKYK